MARPFTSDPSGLSALQVLTTSAGLWDAMTLRLFKNNITPGPDTPSTEYEEADFDGYAAVAGLDRLALGHNQEGIPTAWWVPQAFTMSGITTPNVIYGWMITSVSGVTIWVARRLDEPVSMSEVSQVLIVAPEISWRE